MPVLQTPLTRSYTPPTCTLEVTAQTSALSRWSQTPIVRSLDFLLSFDSLQADQREPVEIRGDRGQFNALADAVTLYLQQLLAARHSTLTTQGTHFSEPVPESASIHLSPRSLLTHELHLGDLATNLPGSSIVLKVSQLFDLATALDACASDLQQIPEVTPRRTWVATPLVRSAAAVLLAVGVGTAAWQLFQGGTPFVVTRSTPEATSDRLPESEPAAPEQPQVKTAPSSPRPSVNLKLPKIQLPSRTTPPDIIARNTPTDPSPALKAPAANEAAPRSLPPASTAPPPSITLPSLPDEPAPLNNTIPESLNDAVPEQDIVQSAPEARMERGESAADIPANEQTAQSLAKRAQPPTAPPAGSSALSEFSTARQRAEDSTQSFSAAPEPTLPPAEAELGAAAKPPEASALHDKIGQVQEVRQYVSAQVARTPPPKTVEYRLMLKRDGKLEQVQAISPGAEDYLPQLSLPKANQPFVAPLTAPTSVRLLIRPDGTVQTFVEDARL